MWACRNASARCRAAAREAIDGPGDAGTQAIAFAAARRLERGIWTSPGAGDVRRAAAAAERLVLLLGEAEPRERRDLAALYAAQGFLGRARAELAVFRGSAAAARETPEDAALVDGLWRLVCDAEAAEGEAVSVESALRAQVPEDVARPLTW